MSIGGGLIEAGGLRVVLRPAVEADYEELVRVYASTRAAELAQVTWWDDDQKLAFCRAQYDAQKEEYDARFPDAEYDVIELEGRTVGRVWVGRAEEEIRLLDIALLPEAQRRGLGAADRRRAHRGGARREQAPPPHGLHAQHRGPTLLRAPRLPRLRRPRRLPPHGVGARE